MKSTFTAILISLGLCVSASLSQATAPVPLPPLPSFFIGYNEAWFGKDYGSSLTKNFKPAYVEEVFKGIQAAGGDIVRLWLFEERQGFIFSGPQAQVKGVDPRLLRNVAKTLQLARKYKLRVYLTLFDGNDMPEEEGAIRNYYLNLLNNNQGEADAFREKVLKPLLQVLEDSQDLIYGLDLMNEIEAPMMRHFWSERWDGPRKWMQDMRSFIKVQSPWLKVSTSSGWHLSYVTIASGLFSNIGMDFYDLHSYSDVSVSSLVFAGACYRANIDNVPLILGEFGQLKQESDDVLQAKMTATFLLAAKKSCFAGVLAWRFDKSERVWSYINADGSLRPAASTILSFKASLVPGQ